MKIVFLFPSSRMFHYILSHCLILRLVLISAFIFIALKLFQNSDRCDFVWQICFSAIAWKHTNFDNMVRLKWIYCCLSFHKDFFIKIFSWSFHKAWKRVVKENFSRKERKVVLHFLSVLAIASSSCIYYICWLYSRLFVKIFVISFADTFYQRSFHEFINQKNYLNLALMILIKNHIVVSAKFENKEDQKSLPVFL